MPKLKRRFDPTPYLLLLPTVIFVALFTAWPTLISVYQSFFRQQLNIAKYRVPSFIGIGNYQKLFTDERFLLVLKNTAIYVIFTVPLSLVLAFLFALLLNRKLRGIGFARLAFFHPTILPMVSAATIWMFFFTPDYGIFNTTLTAIGYNGPQNWTANPDLALLSVMIVAVWKNAGYYMIFYLAGIQRKRSPRFVLDNPGTARVSVVTRDRKSGYWSCRYGYCDFGCGALALYSHKFCAFRAQGDRR